MPRTGLQAATRASARPPLGTKSSLFAARTGWPPEFFVVVIHATKADVQQVPTDHGRTPQDRLPRGIVLRQLLLDDLLHGFHLLIQLLLVCRSFVETLDGDALDLFQGIEHLLTILHPLIQHIHHRINVIRAQVSTHGVQHFDHAGLLIQLRVDQAVGDGIDQEILQLSHVCDINRLQENIVGQDPMVCRHTQDRELLQFVQFLCT
mmetsp:Transcript_46596/g.78217  ORF Transcript_46596/g.78217 Transcript_46596/m.78217 type:complete len:206 (+) Transcript_46596:323-940(+)